LARILLIDDDPQILDLLQGVLTEAGHECFCAKNGAIGFKILEQAQIDLVVTDLIMPVAEGIETIMKIRSSGHRIPILAISGGIPMVASDFLPAAARLGADRTLTKPFDIIDFMQTVNELLGSIPRQ
jgi:two-component system chemotaxis response regulator CheY